MRLFVTGATGWVGTALVPELVGAGHEVVGLARSDVSAAKLEAAGATAHLGSLHDLESLRRGVQDADGVIHCAFIHDFSQMQAAGAADLAAIQTMGGVLEGSGRPLVITSGTGLLAQGEVATEQSQADPESHANHRVASEVEVLRLADRGVRSSIVRLPPSVHGMGDHAFVPALIGIAHQHGVSAYIGEGQNRWPAVHVSDAARCFRLAAERAPAGSVAHAIGDEGIPTREIAAAIGQGLGLPVSSIAPDEAASHFTWLAGFFAADVPATCALTRERLGWQATGPGLIADLEEGHYFESV